MSVDQQTMEIVRDPFPRVSFLDSAHFWLAEKAID